MLGTGFLRHIYRNTVHRGVISWAELLLSLASETGCDLSDDIKCASQGLVGYWESLCFQVAHQQRIQASMAENLLRNKIQEFLGIECEEFFLQCEPGACEQIWQRRDRFLSLGFRNILNYNFDRTLSFTKDSTPPRIEPSNTNSLVGRKYKSAKLHGMPPGNVWHPHGDLGAKGTILLGIRQYGLQISELEKSRVKFKSEESEDKHYDEDEWYKVAVNAPLVLLGLGLSPDEWDIWWFLTNRTRNHSKLEPRQEPRLYRLVAINDADSNAVDWLNIGQHRIIDLCADSWDEAWERFYECFS